MGFVSDKLGLVGHYDTVISCSQVAPESQPVPVGLSIVTHGAKAEIALRTAEEKHQFFLRCLNGLKVSSIIIVGDSWVPDMRNSTSKKIVMEGSEFRDMMG